MTLVNRGNAPHYVWGEVCEGWRLLAREDLSVIQERIPPGRGEVRHYHRRARQLFFVLEGELEIPPGRRHRVWNPASADALFLVVSAPTTQGDRVDVAD
jgi:mannose-6-phosphate isomerase-like protein (cupin superfamily)